MVPTRSNPTGRDGEWMGLGEAARLLGVAPTTLRRWADDGVVRSFVTPGGHRRFLRSSLQSMIPTDRQRPPLPKLGETPERMARAYRRQAVAAGPDAAWIRGMQSSERDPLRERGRGLSTALLAYLDAATDADRRARLAEASEVAAEYGRVARLHGATVHDTVATFLRFSRPFVGEIATLARRRNLDTVEATGLLESTLGALDALLLVTIEAHEAGAGGGAGRPTATPDGAGPVACGIADLSGPTGTPVPEVMA